MVLSCKNKRAVKQQEACHRSALRVAPCRHPPARPGYRPVRCALAASSGDFLCTHSDLAGLGAPGRWRGWARYYAPLAADRKRPTAPRARAQVSC